MVDYTPDQEREVKRILSTDASDYYKLLGTSKSQSEAQIKKAYRKLAIKLHPDKNKHPQSAEAFKRINKAWEVLGDEKKRSFFDQTGQDPDSRSQPPPPGSAGSGAGGSGFGSGFGNGRAAPGGGGFYYNGSPFGGMGGGPGGVDQDLFDMLFGGGRNNGFTFTFDGNGFRRAGGQQQPRHRNQRRHGQNGQNGQNGARNGAQDGDQNDSPLLQLFYQYLPLLLVIVPMLFNMIVDAVGTGGGMFDRTPDFAFETSPAYRVERVTPNLGVTYYITDDSHRQLVNKHDNGRTLHRMDTKAEDKFVKDLRTKCRREQNVKEKMIEDAYGFFRVDHNKLKTAQEFPTESCDRLRQLNLL